jgi:ribonuclease G
MSDFGLVQITRQRIRPSVVNSVSKVCPMCGGSGSVVSRDTIVTDIASWLSKFKSNTEYRTVDIYINPFLRSYLTKGLFSISFRWMLKFRIRITLVADDTISLNEFKVTISGSDIDITEAIVRGEDIDKMIEAGNQEIYEPETAEEAEKENGLDYYERNDNSDRQKRPPRPQKGSQSRQKEKS